MQKQSKNWPGVQYPLKDFGKALLKTKSSPIFFSYKLSERKPLFEIAHWVSSILS